MADLSEIQASNTVKVVGSDASGVEQTPVRSTPNGELKNADFINASIVQTTLSVGTGASVQAVVGGSPLTNRKSLLIQALGTNITYGFTSGSQPFTLANGATVQFSIGDTVSLWLRRSSGSGTVNVAIAEFA